MVVVIGLSIKKCINQRKKILWKKPILKMKMKLCDMKNKRCKKSRNTSLRINYWQNGIPNKSKEHP